MSGLGAFCESGLGGFIQSALGARGCAGGLQLVLAGLEAAVCGCLDNGNGTSQHYDIGSVDGTYPLVEQGRVGDVVTYKATGSFAVTHKSFPFANDCTGIGFTTSHIKEFFAVYDESVQRVTDVYATTAHPKLFEWTGSVALGVAVTNALTTCDYTTTTAGVACTGGTATVENA